MLEHVAASGVSQDLTASVLEDEVVDLALVAAEVQVFAGDCLGRERDNRVAVGVLHLLLAA
jgi:hypothetical protein